MGELARTREDRRTLRNSFGNFSIFISFELYTLWQIRPTTSKIPTSPFHKGIRQAIYDIMLFFTLYACLIFFIFYSSIYTFHCTSFRFIFLYVRKILYYVYVCVCMFAGWLGMAFLYTFYFCPMTW